MPKLKLINQILSSRCRPGSMRWSLWIPVFTGMTLVFLFSMSQAEEIFNTPHGDLKKQEQVQTTQSEPSDTNNNDFANTYFANCNKTRNPVMSVQTQELFCACTAAQIQRGITVEEMKQAQTNTPEGQTARNKIAIEVYSPCIEYPTADLIKSSCLSNTQIKTVIPNTGPLCDCMSTKTGQFVKANARSVMEDALRANPNSTDPLGAFMNSQAFASKSQQLLLACLQENGLQ